MKDLFKKPEEPICYSSEGSVEWIKDQVKKEAINPSRHFKKFGTKRPIEKFVAKKVSWREDL